jgi:ankyrin repeat protein
MADTDAFIIAASVPLNDWHASATKDEADQLLALNPAVSTANIYSAAVLGDDKSVASFLKTDKTLAVQKGGPHNWDPLTYLCFSRYLKLDPSRSEGFMQAAKLLLDAGADANSGWYETHHFPKPEWEPVLYGASGIAHHPGITRLLIDHGADPNENEVVYHTPESHDNQCMKILLDTGRLTDENIILMLIRKHDWHDEKGVQMILETGIDPNLGWKPGFTPLLHGIARDNGAIIIQLLLDHGADPTTDKNGVTPVALAAQRGRNDLLAMFEQKGFSIELPGLHKLISACARDDQQTINTIRTDHPEWIKQLQMQGGKLLAEFSGNNNTTGIRNLLSLGIPVNALYQGDGYFEIPAQSTALHVASWRAQHDAGQCLIDNGADLNARNGKGETPLILAIRAATHSYWTYRRNTDSIQALLKAGASVEGIAIPTGYPEADALLKK